MNLNDTEHALWRPLYQSLRALEYGTALTYDQLNELAGCDVRESRGRLLRADKELKAKDQRTLVNDRGVGYHVALPSEHLPQAQKRQQRANRQLRKGLTTTRAAARGRLTQQERTDLENYEMRLSRLEQVTRKNTRDIQQSRIEFKGANAALQEQIDQLKADVVRVREEVSP